MKKRELGAWGERSVSAYLERKGYRVLERNFRCRMGEIDLIVQKDDILAFVEVKLRRNALHGEARGFVTWAKKQKLRTTASWYLMSHPGAEEQRLRFDVAEVYAPEGAEGPVTIRYLENAFE